MQDMASEERKQADAKIVEDNLFKTLGAGEQEAETDAFQCGRCKQVRFLLRFLLFTKVFNGPSAQMPLPPSPNAECR